MKLRTLRRLFPISVFSFVFLAAGTERVTAESSTGIRKLSVQEDLWLVEISRRSAIAMLKSKADHKIIASLQNLVTGFDSYSEPNFGSAGFHWRKKDDETMCEVFLLRDGELDQDQQISQIEYDANGSCKDNATALATAASNVSVARYCRAQSSCGAIAQYVQGHYVASVAFGSAEVGVKGLARWYYVNPWSDGYVVGEGDTLSGIAKELTGKESNRSDLVVLSESDGMRIEGPSVIAPNDKVYLSASLSSEHLPVLFPGKRVYADELVNDKVGIGVDVAVISGWRKEVKEAMIAANPHISEKSFEAGVLEHNAIVWIPTVATGWKEVDVTGADPVEISEREYGSESYAPLIAAICPGREEDEVSHCIVPTFEVPEIDSEVWKDILDAWKGLQGLSGDQ